MSETGEMISVMCSCGKKLKAPASAVGRKAKCPKCNNIVTITAPPPPAEDEDDPFGAMYDLAAEGEQQVKVAEAAPRCPGCARPLAAGAVLCTNCGYDTRKGKSVAPKAAAIASPSAPAGGGTRYDPAKAAAAKAALANSSKGGVDKMAPQGSYFKGLGACIGGAAVGGVVWFMIAYFTGYELYIASMLIAVGAGLGMQWGHEGYSNLGGLTAAGVTLVTLIIARVAVVLALIVPMMKADLVSKAAEKQADKEALRMPDLSMYDHRVVEQFYGEERQKLKSSSVEAPPVAQDTSISDEDEGSDEVTDSPFAREEAAAYQAVEKRLKALPKPQYAALIAKLDREERDERLSGYMTEKVMGELHVSYRDGSVIVNQAAKTAQERIAKMTEAEKDAAFKQFDADRKKKEAELLAQMREAKKQRAARGERELGDGPSSGAVAAIGTLVILYLVFGGIKGFIFTMLSLGLAYRTASGSISG